MAILPLKQTVTITRKGAEDEWGDSTTETFSLKCRVDEEAKLVRRTSTSGGGATQISTEQVVTAATITFDKLADIRHDDEIRFTDELGRLRIYKPLNIEVVRNIAGKPILTEVSV